MLLVAACVPVLCSCSCFEASDYEPLRRPYIIDARQDDPAVDREAEIAEDFFEIEEPAPEDGVLDGPEAADGLDAADGRDDASGAAEPDGEGEHALDPVEEDVGEGDAQDAMDADESSPDI